MIKDNGRASACHDDQSAAAPVLIRQIPAHVVTAMLAAAARAPSVHNTQPWRFAVGERVIDLYADPSRKLSQDRDGRQILISCGAELPEGRAFVLDRICTPEMLGPNLVDPLRRLFADLDGPAITRNRSLWDKLAEVLAVDEVTVLRTDEDVRAAEREQWDDGTNYLAVAPGVVFGYERNVPTEHHAAQARNRGRHHRGQRARAGPWRPALHDLSHRP